MCYILKASPKAFIKLHSDEELIITSDYEKAIQYTAIGEAMKAASEINQVLGVHTFKVESYKLSN